MPKNLRAAVQAKLETLIQVSDPAKLAKPLSGKLSGLYRVKVHGNVRIVFYLYPEGHEIDVTLIDFRGNVYN
jgi:mRNA-degrading endonuclease RelE of RelBE toxin-antitoxin system